MQWAWFTDVRLKNKTHSTVFEASSQIGKTSTKQPIDFRDRPFDEKQTVWAWLSVHLCQLPSQEQSMTLLDSHLKFYSIKQILFLTNRALSLWTDIQYADKGYHVTKKWNFQPQHYSANQ